VNKHLDDALQALRKGGSLRFLDCLVSLQAGLSGAAEYTVRGDEPFLRGHFPGQPLFPGVLLIEAAAQLASVVARTSQEDRSKMRELKLASLRGVKIVGTAKPGQTIFLEAKVSGRVGSVVQCETSAAVNGQVVMQATMAFTF
jgi:3-hydroxyacyl-[acyl-carrier-protein] dehydratase